jgi:hypothetical protein
MTSGIYKGVLLDGKLWIKCSRLLRTISNQILASVPCLSLRDPLWHPRRGRPASLGSLFCERVAEVSRTSTLPGCCMRRASAYGERATGAPIGRIVWHTPAGFNPGLDPKPRHPAGPAPFRDLRRWG